MYRSEPKAMLVPGTKESIGVKFALVIPDGRPGELQLGEPAEEISHSMEE
jgi:hypothetical protein